ncbi:hypothetical protein RHMOL_Rhmol05G0179500 [Rhododendron molle]|uniref:Uncharacterized protein n=1 Tax=Rhododendron molle TaxID=49168 RepID=A0ACC0NQN8_RHOML|nr:hypothetical protein RHMOL_Rhmol05G0179500 [Rhododendron molle]
MKSSGVLVDCSELKSQLNLLKEHHEISRYQSSGSDACGKGKRDANSAAMVTGESSSKQSAIEDSNGIPSVVADLPNSDELQPTTTSESLPIVVSETVFMDSVDKGSLAGCLPEAGLGLEEKADDY